MIHDDETDGETVNITDVHGNSFTAHIDHVCNAVKDILQDDFLEEMMGITRLSKRDIYKAIEDARKIVAAAGNKQLADTLEDINRDVFHEGRC